MLDDIFTLLGMLLTVVVVLVLAYLCTKHLAVRMPGAWRGPGKGENMTVLDQLVLGRDQRLVLVRVGERYLLLGVTPSGVNTLGELTENEARHWKETRGEAPGGSGELPSFRASFLQALNRNKK